MSRFVTSHPSHDQQNQMPTYFRKSHLSQVRGKGPLATLTTIVTKKKATLTTLVAPLLIFMHDFVLLVK